MRFSLKKPLHLSLNEMRMIERCIYKSYGYNFEVYGDRVITLLDYIIKESNELVPLVYPDDDGVLSQLSHIHPRVCKESNNQCEHGVEYGHYCPECL